MITKQFLEKLNATITVEHYNIIVEFFIIFSRFESALKASGCTNGSVKVSANWDSFIERISNNFDPERTEKLKNAVEYLIQNPPKKQSIVNAELGWTNRFPQPNTLPPITQLNLSIRGVRNNLFHGGELNGNYQTDLSRDFTLITSSIIVLNEWLGLDETVKDYFLQPI